MECLQISQQMASQDSPGSVLMTTENVCAANIIIVAFNICKLELLTKALCSRDFSVITFFRDSKVIVRESNMYDLPLHLRGKSNPQIKEKVRDWQGRWLGLNECQVESRDSGR
jgi:hypothetical protein